MKPTTLAVMCAAGVAGSYLAWTAAAADDYDHGFKHLAAMATGVLGWVFAVGFIAALSWAAWRSIRERRSGHRGA